MFRFAGHRSEHDDAAKPARLADRRPAVPRQVPIHWHRAWPGATSVRHQDQGVETWNGKALHRVKVTFAAGTSTDASDEYVYWFDPETGRVEQFAYSYEGNPGGLRFRKAFDHRRVGGILFFDQQNLGIEGPSLSVDQIDPQMVEEQMRLVSTVRLENLRVDTND